MLFELTAAVIEAQLLEVFRQHMGFGETDLREQVLPGLCTGVARGVMDQIEAADLQAEGWPGVEAELGQLVPRYAEHYGLDVTACTVSVSLVTPPPEPARAPGPPIAASSTWWAWLGW